MDAVTLSVLASAFAGISEEMGTLLVRSAYSSNIKERRDCSAALFDTSARMIAQAAHVPVHLGALYESVRVVAEIGTQTIASRSGGSPGDPATRGGRNAGDVERDDASSVGGGGTLPAEGGRGLQASCPDPGHTHDDGVDADRLGAGDIAPGDVWVLNDPFCGGNHLPDVTLVSPLYLGDLLVGYAATRAHHSDMGGSRPGSMPADSREIFAEGLVIPPVRLLRAGVWQADVLDLICANSRTPDLRRGDLRAQAAANRLAATRLAELAERYEVPSRSRRQVSRRARRDDQGAEGLDAARPGSPSEANDDHEGALRGREAAPIVPPASGEGRRVVLEAFDTVLAYGERRSRALVAALPDGVYTAEGEIEGDGTTDVDIPIRVAVVIDGDCLTVDFTGTSPAVPGNVNCPRAVTRSACCFALRVLLPDDVPANDGTYAPLTVVTGPGSLVDARRPSAVVAGNVETSQRIADTVLAAFAQAVEAAAVAASHSPPTATSAGSPGAGVELPLLPAQGQGTMNNLVIGGSGWTYYETLAGGQGASAAGPGASGVHVGMTNTLNTPIEALELEYPMRVERYELDDATAGAGQHAGGAGLVRSIRVLEPATLSLLSDRRRHAPQGAAGGGPGGVGRNDVDGEPLPPKASRTLPAGAVVTVRTPGGGGWGPPSVA